MPGLIRDPFDLDGEVARDLRDVDRSAAPLELVTNALLHGRGPVELRDMASYLPRRLRPTLEDEHGRGLQLVSMLADRGGTRPTREGKAVWCVFSLTRHSSYPTPTPPSPTLVE